jgi:tetratricopeptide (TPR) repeat protein
MSTTLNLLDHLLSRGRALHTAGFAHEASLVFERLASLRSLPAEIAEEVQERLGELRLHAGQYKKARRHFAAAISGQPKHARYHYLLATATQADDACDRKDALEHLCRAVECEPTNANYLCELGLQAMELGEVEQGLEALRRAATAAPGDPEVLAKVADGLRLGDQLDEARLLLRAAQFRHPRDRRFQNLWTDFQFQLLHDEQQAEKQRVALAEEKPRLLPFVRPEPAPRGRRVVRKDAASSPKGPHQRQPAPRKRHA